MPDKVALGFCAHTGWAICVAASGSLKKPRVVLRDRVEFLGDEERFVFHRAELLGLARGKESVARVTKLARASTKKVLAALAQRLEAERFTVTKVAVVAKTAPMPGPLEKILASHPRIHTAEGCFYRDLLVDTAKALSLEAHVVSPIDLADFAAEKETAAALATIGKTVGRPWSKDHRLAALAAWVALAG